MLFVTIYDNITISIHIESNLREEIGVQIIVNIKEIFRKSFKKTELQTKKKFL